MAKKKVKPLSRYMIRKTRIVWERMIARCTDLEHPMFKHFGGKGIKVCKPWLVSFDRFLRDMGPRPGKRVLERIDRDEDYKPSNCEWSNEREVDHSKFPRKVSKPTRTSKPLRRSASKDQSKPKPPSGPHSRSKPKPTSVLDMLKASVKQL